MLKTGIGNVHNLWEFFAEEDLVNHRKWFSEDAAMKDGAGNAVRLGQPCFTAHGDKEEYSALIEYFSNKVIAKLREMPTITCMRISQNDTVGGNLTLNCGCTACAASYDY